MAFNVCVRSPNSVIFARYGTNSDIPLGIAFANRRQKKVKKKKGKVQKD